MTGDFLLSVVKYSDGGTGGCLRLEKVGLRAQAASRRGRGGSRFKKPMESAS